MNWGEIFRGLALRVLRFFVLLYVGLLLFGFFFSEGMIFAPQRPSYRDDGSIIKLSTADGAKISAIYLTNESARFTILYSHGNAEDIGDVRPALEALRSTGFNVFAYDYHGYGTSEGKPGERNSYRDIDSAYGYLTNSLRVTPSDIIVFGRSVGSGPSVDLASRRAVGGLIIQSGFVSAFRVMTHKSIAPFDRFNNLAKIKKVKCPVLIMHGTADTVIPLWHGEKLFEAANEPKQIVRIEDANHNDFNEVAGPKYFEAIRDFVGKL